MNISKRIYLNSGATTNVINDKYIQIKLEQNVKTIEVLSMKIGTEDVYQNVNADYGVLVGRVIANGGVGIPNAKISIFIPLTDDDANDSEIYSVYPYKTPRDKNLEGKRYNLLPRVSQYDFTTKTFKPRQPFGSMFTKPELMVNDVFMRVYKKYYKYTALTNKTGDYMIYGVPVGTHTVHMSVDITDIGEYSMNPASMVTNLGYSPNLFTDNNTRIKESNDIDDLPHIETQEISVDIRPFWGDRKNFEIGITRQDFRIRANIVSQFTIFGSVFTDGEEVYWGGETNSEKYAIKQMYRMAGNEEYKLSIRSKRIGKVTEKIYYYPNTLSDEEIERRIATNDYTLHEDLKLLDPSEYSVYKRDGDFVFIINCNRKKVIINDFGERIVVPDSYNGGIYTEFKGFVTLEITEDDLKTPNVKHEDVVANGTRSLTSFRTRIKIPQKSPQGLGFQSNDWSINASYNPFTRWRNEHFTFSANTIYSIARFHALVKNSSGSNNADEHNTYNGFEEADVINNLNTESFYNVGVILADGNENNKYEFPTNGTTILNDVSGKKAFGGNWLNFSLYLPQMSYATSENFEINVNTYFRHYLGFSKDFLISNNQPIADKDTDTKWFLRSDLNWTDFIAVPENEIRIFRDFPKKGGNLNISHFMNINKLNYMYGEKDCPYGGGRRLGIPSNSIDSNVYFYKGFDTADCIDFVSRILNIQ